MKKDILIYRHIRLDTNQVFYIGIGNSVRPFTKHRRSQFWNNIVNKTEYEIQILKCNLTWEEACELERLLIFYYGRKDNGTGILCNMTNGGEGSYGRKQTQECKDKISKANIGRQSITKGRVRSLEHSLNISKSKKGVRNIRRMKKIININTHEIYLHIDDVLKIINVKKTTLFSYLNGNIKTNPTPFRYLL